MTEFVLLAPARTVLVQLATVQTTDAMAAGDLFEEMLLMGEIDPEKLERAAPRTVTTPYILQAGGSRIQQAPLHGSKWTAGRGARVSDTGREFVVFAFEADGPELPIAILPTKALADAVCGFWVSGIIEPLSAADTAKLYRDSNGTVAATAVTG